MPDFPLGADFPARALDDALHVGESKPVPFELVWLSRSFSAPQVTELIRHFRDVVPKLISGSAKLGK